MVNMIQQSFRHISPAVLYEIRNSSLKGFEHLLYEQNVIQLFSKLLVKFMTRIYIQTFALRQ